jgi:hypothetical protein
MSHSQPRQYFAATQRAVANADAIEWEELPSLLAPSLAQRLVTRARGERGHAVRANDSQFEGQTIGGTLWDATMPAEFDPTPVVSQPFREAMAGVSMREVIEPDVFHHFFGPSDAT